MTIHIAVKGGLGNQLFQYAFGLYLQNKFNAKIYFDVTPLSFNEQNLTKRTLELNAIDSTLLYTPHKINKLFYNQKDNILLKVLKKTVRSLLNYNYVSEQNFNETSLKQNKTYYLDGYWQNNLYAKFIFDNIKGVEKELLYNNTYLDLILSEKESCAIHVRRGDYITNKTIQAFHGNCNEDYFFKAMEIIESQKKMTHYFVFSDDMEWAKKIFNTKVNVTFVEQNQSTPLIDLLLMKHCSNFIISNSSFSCWATYLCANKNKTVLAPIMWTKTQATNTTSLFNTNWQLI